MQANRKVELVSLCNVPAVALYERDQGMNVPVMYLLVRTDYDETYEQAVKRAERVARELTSNTAIKKIRKFQGNTNHTEENMQNGYTSKG